MEEKLYKNGFFLESQTFSDTEDFELNSTYANPDSRLVVVHKKNVHKPSTGNYKGWAPEVITCVNGETQFPSGYLLEKLSNDHADEEHLELRVEDRRTKPKRLQATITLNYVLTFLRIRLVVGGGWVRDEDAVAYFSAICEDVDAAKRLIKEQQNQFKGNYKNTSVRNLEIGYKGDAKYRIGLHMLAKIFSHRPNKH